MANTHYPHPNEHLTEVRHLEINCPLLNQRAPLPAPLVFKLIKIEDGWEIGKYRSTYFFSKRIYMRKRTHDFVSDQWLSALNSLSYSITLELSKTSSLS